MAAVEQLTFGNEPTAVRAAAGPSGPGYEIERELADAGASCVAGVDEVGRGARGRTGDGLRGDRPGWFRLRAGLTDSSGSARRARPRSRALLSWVGAFAIGQGPGPPRSTRVKRPARAARRRALEACPRARRGAPDGDYIGRPGRCAAPSGRTRSASGAAASVIAKVHRDRLMAGLGHEEFAFAENAGYPSPAHQEALAALGPTPLHRLSWSYLDDLPRWRHLKRPRPDVEGQLSLL